MFAGTNDIAIGFDFGDPNSTDPTEIYGALNLTADGLIAKYPTAKIVFITPYSNPGNEERAPLYRDALFDVCENRGIYVFDNIANGGIDWADEEDKNAYTLLDNIHLNETGHEMASYKYEEFLKQISK